MNIIKNNKQKDNLAKLFYDLSKIVFAILVIGQFAKPLKITFTPIISGLFVIIVFVLIGLKLDNLKYKDNNNG